MINQQDILDSHRQELARHLQNYEAPQPNPLPVTVWMASSLLQKSIRRGEVSFALSAAATLIRNDPRRLWRRLAGIASEDVGSGDYTAVGMMASVMAGKAVRARIGSEWQIAAWLTERLAKATKCRAADDLLMITELHPDLAEQRHALPALSHNQLRLTTLGTAPIEERALALIYLAGTAGKPYSKLMKREGEPVIAFDVLDELGAPLTLIEISREAWRVSRDPLCLMLPFFSAEPEYDAAQITADKLPRAQMTGGIPSWAVDGYTREGKQAIDLFLSSKAGMAQMVRHMLPPAKRVGFIARTLFHVEGGLLHRRLVSPLRTKLRSQNEQECLGCAPEIAGEAMERLSADLSILNACRAKVLEGRDNA